MLAFLPAILVAIGSVCLCLGAFLPALTVISYVVFRPLLQPFAWLQYKMLDLPIAFIFSIIVVSLGPIFVLTRRSWRLAAPRSISFIIFTALALLSAIFSISFPESMAALLKLLTVWFLYNIAYNSVSSEEDAIHIIDAIIFSSVIPLLFGFYQAITGSYDLLYDAEVDRISSVFVTGNDYGIFLTFITAAAAIRLGTTTRRRLRILIMIILAMIIVSQVLSLNRGTWIALTIGFLVSAAKYRKRLNFKLISVGLIVFTLIFSGKIIERFEELDNPSRIHYSGTNTMEGRFDYWRKLIPIIMERPLQGYGIGTSPLVAEKKFRKQQRPHNDYLQIAVEMGVLGLIAYIFFLARILFYFIMRRESPDLWIWNFSMLMLSVYFIVISGAQNIVHSVMNFPIFLILIGIGFKINLIKSDSSNKENGITKLRPSRTALS